MSDSERPDVTAFRELEQVIHALGDEMAAWRRRAHESEAQLRQVGEHGAAAARGVDVGALERENQELRQRLEAARQRTKQLLERLRFLRQQHKIGAER